MKKLTCNKVMFSYIIFYVLLVGEIWVSGRLMNSNQTNWLSTTITFLLHFTMSYLFVFTCIKLYRSYLRVPFREMIKPRTGGKYSIIAFTIYVGYFIILILFFYKGKIYTESQINPIEFISAVIVAPLTEEIIFRGWFYNVFTYFLRETEAVVLSALFFMAAHVHKYQSFFGFNWKYCISIFVFGIILAWLFRKTKSLWPCMILHCFYNLMVSLIFVYLHIN